MGQKLHGMAQFAEISYQI